MVDGVRRAYRYDARKVSRHEICDRGDGGARNINQIVGPQDWVSLAAR